MLGSRKIVRSYRAGNNGQIEILETFDRDSGERVFYVNGPTKSDDGSKCFSRLVAETVLRERVKDSFGVTLPRLTAQDSDRWEREEYEDLFLEDEAIVFADREGRLHDGFVTDPKPEPDRVVIHTPDTGQTMVHVKHVFRRRAE